jgi:hypothetical protein
MNDPRWAIVCFDGDFLMYTIPNVRTRQEAEQIANASEPDGDEDDDEDVGVLDFSVMSVEDAEALGAVLIADNLERR